MNKKNYFQTVSGKRIKLPLFFPDATRAVLKTLDSEDIKNTKTPGILVNTYHLYLQAGQTLFSRFDGVRDFMRWSGGLITDSGGFQVMSVIKKGIQKGRISDRGIHIYVSNKKKIVFTPEVSIKFQMLLKPDVVVVLDDYSDIGAGKIKTKETVERTIEWARRSKKEFVKICAKQKLNNLSRPRIFCIVQGGDYLDLRKECAQALVKIGFDGYGHGGWPVHTDGHFNYDVVDEIVKNTPEEAYKFGFGIGKPEEIVNCVRRGFNMFDCVLPTRDARHRRLYVYNEQSINKININSGDFYSFYTPDKERFYKDTRPISTACDCLLCTKYTRAYLAHLFRIKEMTAGRLATIHNLRFYSILMEKLQAEA